MSALNGYSYPQIQLFNGSTYVSTTDLTLCMEKGLVESWQPVKLRHQLINHQIEEDYIGWYGYFTLNYDSYMKKADILELMNLINYYNLGYRLFLVPRADVPSRVFEVIVDNDSFDIGILRGGVNSVGNRLLEFRFRTKYLSFPKFVDPEDITVVLDFEIQTINS